MTLPRKKLLANYILAVSFLNITYVWHQRTLIHVISMHWDDCLLFCSSFNFPVSSRILCHFISYLTIFFGCTECCWLEATNKNFGRCWKKTSQKAVISIHLHLTVICGSHISDRSVIYSQLKCSAVPNIWEDMSQLAKWLRGQQSRLKKTDCCFLTNIPHDNRFLLADPVLYATDYGLLFWLLDSMAPSQKH